MIVCVCVCVCVSEEVQHCDVVQMVVLQDM